MFGFFKKKSPSDAELQLGAEDLIWIKYSCLPDFYPCSILSLCWFIVDSEGCIVIVIPDMSGIPVGLLDDMPMYLTIYKKISELGMLRSGSADEYTFIHAGIHVIHHRKNSEIIHVQSKGEPLRLDFFSEIEKDWLSTYMLNATANHISLKMLEKFNLCKKVE
jgi:hypothetical protein